MYNKGKKRKLMDNMYARAGDKSKRSSNCAIAARYEEVDHDQCKHTSLSTENTKHHQLSAFDQSTSLKPYQIDVCMSIS